jgi:hypothetical protein
LFIVKRAGRVKKKPRNGIFFDGDHFGIIDEEDWSYEGEYFLAVRAGLAGMDLSGDGF